VQERVDVPEPPVMLFEEKLHDRFVELVVTERETVPVKPFTGDTVIIEVPTIPWVTATLVGLAFIVKSERAEM
jgi:hypothetical protein